VPSADLYRHAGFFLTSEADELVRSLNERMPVIVYPQDKDEWLDPRSTPDSLSALLIPFAVHRMGAFPVNPYVNNPKYHGPQCIELVGA
jgi:putative SOS response-associated peptidase YedK